jgi:tRNA threonylcarbamoyladenosine biosynthesis protein TsaB
MILLALELSSTRRSAALCRKAEVAGPAELLGQLSEGGGRSTRPLPLVDAVLSQAGLERSAVQGLVVGLGPGSYTGIRSALAIAQGWQLARGVAVTGVSSVECLAAQAQAQGWHGKITVAIDAQRTEFYVATYDVTPGGWHVSQPLRLVPSADVKALCQAAGGLLIGPEVDRISPDGRVLFPAAEALFRCAPVAAAGRGAEHLTPIYLREANFVKSPPRRVIPE